MWLRNMSGMNRFCQNGPFNIMMSWGEKVGIKKNIYMETSCFRVFMLLNYMKAYVSMYFLHLMLTFPPQNDVLVNGPLGLRGATVLKTLLPSKQ